MGRLYSKCALYLYASAEGITELHAIYWSFLDYTVADLADWCSQEYCRYETDLKSSCCRLPKLSTLQSLDLFGLWYRGIKEGPKKILWLGTLFKRDTKPDQLEESEQTGQCHLLDPVLRRKTWIIKHIWILLGRAAVNHSCTTNLSTLLTINHTLPSSANISYKFQADELTALCLLHRPLKMLLND